MAHLKSQLVQKLSKVLTKAFPPPATVELEEHGGIIGVIRSSEFAGMESLKRQDLIGGIVKSKLSLEERRRVEVIVGVTPEEGTGYVSTDKKWRVRYNAQGSSKEILIEWPARPPRDVVARRIWREELPGPQIIPTTERGDTNPTITQLGKKGIKITGIEEVID